jgi:hypothetical protein
LFAYFDDKNLVSRIFRGGDEFMTEYANGHNTLFEILYGKLLRSRYLGVLYRKILNKILTCGIMWKAPAQPAVMQAQVLEIKE